MRAYYNMDDYYDSLEHHGIKGQKWGVRRFRNKDGSLTAAGKRRASKNREFSPEEEAQRAKRRQIAKKAAIAAGAVAATAGLAVLGAKLYSDSVKNDTIKMLKANGEEAAKRLIESGNVLLSKGDVNGYDYYTMAAEAKSLAALDSALARKSLKTAKAIKGDNARAYMQRYGAEKLRYTPEDYEAYARFTRDSWENLKDYADVGDLRDSIRERRKVGV